MLSIVNILVVLGALSVTPGYPGDGIRHFLVIYPALGYLVMMGMLKKSGPRMNMFFVVLVFFALVFENIIVFPEQFKYYNAFVGREEGVLRWGLREQYYP